jgi:hypothetical protein
MCSFDEVCTDINFACLDKRQFYPFATHFLIRIYSVCFGFGGNQLGKNYEKLLLH